MNANLFPKSGGCFTVGADNIVVDGNGYTLMGTGTGEGVSIVVDGNGYTLMGTGTGEGVSIVGKTGVTVKQFHIKNFSTGVYLGLASTLNEIKQNAFMPDTDSGSPGCAETYVPCGCVGGKHSFVCGDVVTESCMLNCDIEASGECFTLGADGITIDGGGHTITGNLREFGIRSGQKTGFTIRNITLKNFSQAIFPDPGSSGGTIANVTLTENNYGLQMSDADSNTVSESVVTGNIHTGILMDGLSHGNTAMENEIYGNVHGVRLENSSQNTISENEIAFNQQAGIYTDADSEDNMLLSNDVCSPLGFMAFGLENITPGDCIDAVLYLPLDESINTYFKYDPTPNNSSDHWYDFYYDGQTGAEIFHEASRTRIILHLCDGLRGDGDLSADGDISEPGAASHMAYTARFVDEDGNCGNANHPCHDSLQDAVDQVDIGIECIVSITGETYYEALVMNEDKTVILKGGWDETFTTQAPGHPAFIAPFGPEDAALSITAGTVMAECIELD